MHSEAGLSITPGGDATVEAESCLSLKPESCLSLEAESCLSFKPASCLSRVRGDRDAAPILRRKSFNLKPSGNEVYRTNTLLLRIKFMLCSKLHCQKVLN